MPTKKATLSPVATRLLDAAVDFKQNPDPTDKAYLARQLVQCTLPHSDPGDTPIWVRTNGNLKLVIKPDFDRETKKALYPYGTVPRLLLFWIVTEAVRTKSRRLHLGDSFAAFAREVGLSASNGGGKRSDKKRLQEQFTRLMRSTISFEQTGASRMNWVDMQIGPRAALWWDPDKLEQSNLFSSWVELGEDFFEAVTAAPVPLDTRALLSLRNSSLALDLYSWLTYKGWNATRKSLAQSVSWASLHAQMGSDYAEVRDFRKKVRALIPKIALVYPTMRVSEDGDGLVIEPTLPAIPAKVPQPEPEKVVTVGSVKVRSRK